MSKALVFRGSPNLSSAQIDRTQGVIRGVQIIRVGEARGHGVHQDLEFIQDLVELGNAQPKGVKSRFGHPAMSDDALGTELGRFKNFRLQGESAVADLHLGSYAAKSPKGDLREYILTMAEEDPEMFGNSIVFIPGRKYTVNEEGEKEYYGDDIQAGEQPVFVEIESLLASDLVDTPAATDGLFSEVNAHLYAKKLSVFLDENPEVETFLDSHPDLETKIHEFLSKRKQIKTQRATMNDNEKNFWQFLAYKMGLGQSPATVPAAPEEQPEPDQNNAALADMEAFSTLMVENKKLNEQLATTQQAMESLAQTNEALAKKLNALEQQIQELSDQAAPAPPVPQPTPNQQARSWETNPIITKVNEEAKRRFARRQG